MESFHNDRSNVVGDFFCYKCDTHLLIEIIQNKKDIFIRQFCYCGEFTYPINNDIINLIRHFDFYNGYRCHGYKNYIGNDNNITKFCYKCKIKNFLCDECASKHEHQTFIKAEDYINNCKYHRQYKTIGFCKKCKISFCSKCIEENIHINHELIKDFKRDMNDILNIYASNLNKSYIEMRKLIKMKYGKKYNLEIRNLFKHQKISFFEQEDQNIIICLELLTTFIDLYIYKQKNNNLNYQTIYHIIKHRDFEIIRLNDKEKKNNLVPNSRIISIGNNIENINVPQKSNNLFNNIINTFTSGEKKEEINENISILLKIDLKEKEERKNEINIKMDKKILQDAISNFVKIIKLKNGDLACLSKHNKIIISKNLSIYKILEIEERASDIVELDNEKLCVLQNGKLSIYNIKNYELKKETKIKLNENIFYYNLKSISTNKISLLSERTELNLFLNIIEVRNYNLKKIKLLDFNYQADLIQMDDLIVVCCDLLSSCKIFFYNIKNKSIQNIIINCKQSYQKEVKCFKLNKNKILFSTIHTGMIINVKTKQVETFFPGFKNIYCMEKIGKYLIVSSYDLLGQIDLKYGKLFNKYKPKFEVNKKYKYIKNIIPLENNKFCVLYDNDVGVIVFDFN